MKTSIILPVWQPTDDHLKMTMAMFGSLAQTEGLEQGEIIVVDNASPIGGDLLQSYSDLYIRGTKNKGYPWAVNQGLKLCSGDLICVPNNDIRVSPNWYKVATEILQDPEVGSVHFRMIGYEEPFSFGTDTWKEGKERWCSSSFFVMRWEVIREVGLYDEKYEFFGYDDWDMWYRVRQAGFKTAYTNKACYQHNDSATYRALDQDERNMHAAMNKEYFKKKHGDYAEDLFAKMYPDQMSVNWRPFP